jgi:hypothetical protein
MADITPEALAQMMQMTPPGGAAPSFSMATMPPVTGYEIAEAGQEGEAETFHVTFSSALGRATFASTWKPIMGQWKITAVSMVSVEFAGGPA